METRASPHSYQVTRSLEVAIGEHEEVYGRLASRLIAKCDTLRFR